MHLVISNPKNNPPAAGYLRSALSIKQLLEGETITPNLLDEYLEELRRTRRQLSDLWQKGLHQSYAQVNLPSIFKSYAGRVVESMAAGRRIGNDRKLQTSQKLT